MNNNIIMNLNNNSFDTIEEDKELGSSQGSPKRQKTPLIYSLFIAALLCVIAALIFQLNRAQVEVETLRADVKDEMLELEGKFEDHIKLENSEKQKQRVKINFLREYESQKFFKIKSEKILAYSKTSEFLQRNDKARTSFLLALNNYKASHLDIRLSRKVNEILRSQYQRLSKAYDFSLPQKPFCICVPSINNVQNFRYEYNLRSIINQNYTNYKVIIVDDASTDQNFEEIKRFIEENPVPQKIQVIKNKERMGTLHNIYKASTEFCNPEDIIMLVDGDDEILGVNILKVFNSVYTTRKQEVVYSNFMSFHGYNTVTCGISEPYTDYEKAKNLYREFQYTRMFPIRTFLNKNLLKIHVGDLQDDEGNWFKSASDHAICTPLLQLSCERNEYIDEFFYLYNTDIGNNDLVVDPQLNTYVANQIRRNKKKYQCDVR